jgi:glyoxylase-like metal-dependent hydrolase (beta-lactamase superfamily II)
MTNVHAGAPEYEIFAIKYGQRTGTRGGMFLNADAHDTPLAMDYFVWALRSPEMTIVVDVGFGRDEGERRGREFLRCPTDGLRAVGIDADTVSDVIITHMHYDHAGNLELFPQAQFHIQDEEMEFVTGRAMTHNALRHSFRLDDVLQMVRMVYGDRVVFHAGDAEVAPGVSVHHIGGHTRGLQCVRVNTARGAVVLASDTSHYYENFEQEVTFATVENVFLMHEGFRRLKSLAPSLQHIVPGHDPDVLARYPAASADLQGVAARLDKAPLR